MKALYAQIHAAIAESGPAGVRSSAICQALGTNKMTFKHALVRMKQVGLPYFVISCTRPEGGLYFSNAEHRDAAMAAELALKARIRVESQRRAHQVFTAKRREQRLAQGPQLHAIGEHMKSKARDGKLVTAHQATFDRQRQATLKVQAGPVDYSRAKLTVCPSPPLNRFEPTGPVHSVVDPSDCRGWAKAATGAAA